MSEKLSIGDVVTVTGTIEFYDRGTDTFSILFRPNRPAVKDQLLVPGFDPAELKLVHRRAFQVGDLVLPKNGAQEGKIAHIHLNTYGTVAFPLGRPEIVELSSLTLMRPKNA